MFESQTFESILTRLLSNVSAGVDTREGSVMWNALAPCAIELAQTYGLLETILRETFAQTASREYLILRAGEKGIVPYQATYAEISAQITGENLSSSDLIGKIFSCDSTFYTVIEELSENIYRLRCNTAGSEGNIASGYLTNESYVSNVQLAIITGVLVYGEDEEETEAFRSRYFASLTDLPFAGNISAYKEMLENYDEISACKVIPAWVSNNPNGDVEIVVLGSDYETPDGSEIEKLQQEICPGTFTYTIGSTWSSGDTLEVNGDVYTFKSSGSADTYELLTTWDSGVIASHIFDSFYNATISENVITCGTNYTVTVRNSSGTILTTRITKDVDLTGGTGEGLAPIGHNVQISGAKRKLIIVNFDTTQSSYGVTPKPTLSVIKEIRGELEKTIADFAGRWEQYEDTATIYQSNFVASIQKVAKVAGVENLQISFLGGTPTDESLTLKHDEYLSFVPTKNELRKMVGAFQTSDGVTLETLATNNGGKLRVKVVRDDLNYTYTLYPFVEYDSRLTCSLTFEGDTSTTTDDVTFNYSQLGYLGIGDLGVSDLVSYLDNTYFAYDATVSNSRKLGFGELSFGQSGNIEYVHSGNRNSYDFQTKLGFDLVGTGTLTPVLSDTTCDKTFIPWIALELYIGYVGQYNGISDFNRLHTVYAYVKEKIQEWESIMYENWLESETGDSTRVDLAELGRLIQSELNTKLIPSGYIRIGFIRDSNVTEYMTENKYFNLNSLIPPVVRYQLVYTTQEIEATHNYQNSLWI